MSNSITPVRGTITNPFGSIFSDRFFDSFFNPQNCFTFCFIPYIPDPQELDHED